MAISVYILVVKHPLNAQNAVNQTIPNSQTPKKGRILYTIRNFIATFTVEES